MIGFHDICDDNQLVTCKKVSHCAQLLRVLLLTLMIEKFEALEIPSAVFGHMYTTSRISTWVVVHDHSYLLACSNGLGAMEIIES